MKLKGLLLALPLFLLAACATRPGSVDAGQWIAPGDAVQLAAAAPQRGVTGVFAMTVRGTGTTRRTHLNSEEDYRDQRNLSVTVWPAAAAQLTGEFGAPPHVALLGKQILVAGTARRVRIDFISEGQRTGKYYYQTHVDVTDASQIQVRQPD